MGSKRIYSSEHTHSKGVSEIVLGISNPNQYAINGRGLRYADAFTAGKTGVFHTHDNPTSNENWPQFQVSIPSNAPQYPGVGAAIPLKVPIGQYPIWLFNQVTRASIRYNHNASCRLALYQWYDSDGSFDFDVDCNGLDVAGSTLGPNIPRQLAPGGAVSTPGRFATYAAGTAKPFQNIAAPINASNTYAAHGNSADNNATLAAGVYQGRRYMFNSGGGGGQTYINGAALQNAALPGGILDSQYTVAQCGAIVQGCIVVQQGATPLPAGAHFTIRMTGWNEGEPSIYFTGVDGVVRAGNDVTDAVLAVLQVNQDDYYTLDFAASANTQIANVGHTIRVSQIEGGEILEHKMAAGMYANASTATSSRLIACSLLAQNITAEQYKQGDFVAAQLPQGTSWQNVIDGANPMTFMTGSLDLSILKLNKGAYIFVKPGDVDRMKLRNPIITDPQLPAPFAANNPTFLFELDSDMSDCVCIVFNAPIGTTGVPVTSLQLNFDYAGEYATRNMWIHTEKTSFTAKQWQDAMPILTAMPNVMQNETHDWQTLLASLGDKVGLGDFARNSLSTLTKWAPLIFKAGSALL